MNGSGSDRYPHDIAGEIHRLRDEIKGLRAEVRELKRDLRDQRDIVNRWRGALMAIIGIGGVAGFVMTQIDRVRGWLS